MTGSGERGWIAVALAIVLTVWGVRTAWVDSGPSPSMIPMAPASATPTGYLAPTAASTGYLAPTPTPTGYLAPTASPMGYLAPTASPMGYLAPAATLTGTGEVSLTRSPTYTATPTGYLVPTPTPTGCLGPTPTPTPLRPGRPWPTPDVSRAGTHYWLRRPILPASRCIASAFYPYGSNGMGQYLTHHGADFPACMGTPLHATANGVIVVAGSDKKHVYGLFRNFYGNLIVEKLDQEYHGEPVYVLFGHLSKVEVRAGQRVSAGDVVGRVGEAGIAMGPHLHLEVRIGENSYRTTRNPEFWLRLLPGRGTLVGRLLTPDGRSWPGIILYVRRANAPQKVYQTLYTYVDDPQINPDDEWGENFLWADAPSGEYLLETPWGKQVPFTIRPGGTSFLEIRHDVGGIP